MFKSPVVLDSCHATVGLPMLKGIFGLFERTCGQGCGIVDESVGRPVVEDTHKHIFVPQSIRARGADREAVETTDHAIELMSQGRIHDAVREFHIAQTIAPQCHQTYSNLGVAYHNKSDDDEALTWFREAHRLAPQDAVATVALAFLEQQAGQADEAQWLLLNFLQEVDPNHKNALAQLAHSYEVRKQWQRAAGCYRRLQEADPHNDQWPSLEHFCIERAQAAKINSESPSKLGQGDRAEANPNRGPPSFA